MRIPLTNRLRRQVHRDMASLQDGVVEAVYALEESAVLHGGTAIWRCFDGNRFSEDLDFYLVPKKTFQESLSTELARLGIRITKYRRTENAVYSRVQNENTEVALELATRKFDHPVVSPYERANGSWLDILTPSVNALLIEKLHAFRNRKLIRDIYDVYHLSARVENTPDYSASIRKLLDALPTPLDESNLKNIVLSGAVPSFARMVQALQRRFSK